MPVERLVAHEQLDKVIHCVTSTDQRERTRRADGGARATRITELAFDSAGRGQVDGVVRTGRDAGAAAHTALSAKGDLRARLLRLGILAEHAVQGAALEEHHAANAWAIFQAVAFNVYDERQSWHSSLCNS